MNFYESQDEIENLRDEIFDSLDAINAIKSQIEAAKSNVTFSGHQSDKHWIHRAKWALRKKQQNHQRLLMRLGKMNREIKQEQNEAKERIRERVFIDVVRRMSTKEEYLALWDEVDRRLSNDCAEEGIGDGDEQARI